MYPGRVGAHSGLFSTVWEQASPVLFIITCDGVILSGTGVNGAVEVLLGAGNENSFSTMSQMHHNFLSLDKMLWARVYWLLQLLRVSNMGTQGLIESLGFSVREFHRTLIAGNGFMLHSWVPCCVNSCGISLLHCNRRMVFLTEVIQERKLMRVIVGGFTSDHKSAAVRSQGVWFPSYGRFNVLRRTKLEYSRVMGCPPGLDRLYDRLSWLVHDCCFKMHWGKVVLPLMVQYLHWYWCKWKI